VRKRFWGFRCIFHACFLPGKDLLLYFSQSQITDGDHCVFLPTAAAGEAAAARGSVNFSLPGRRRSGSKKIRVGIPGIKSPTDTEIGENSHFRMDTI
jgi:hypothetical protein